MPSASASVQVSAPPDRVWDVLAEVTRIPEWSPECHRVEWVGDIREARPGARFRGYNRFGLLRWSTVARIEVADPGRELTFVVSGLRDGWGTHSRWTYRLEPAGEGTEVTEAYVQSRELFWPGRLLMRGHRDSMPENLQRSLARLTTVIEREPMSVSGVR